jgi:hypothetical protein
METKLIFQKIPKIMSLVGVVGKDRTNELQKYKFRGIDDMYNALNQHLANENVFFTSEVLESTREERQSKNGGLLVYSIIKMKFTAYAEDGSSVESTTIGEAMDSGDKSMNKAMSTAYKYALMQIFCIPTEEEKDTENQTHEVVPKEYPKPKLDDKIDEIKICNDVEHLKTLYEEWKLLCKSDKQKQFFDWVVTKEKKRIEWLNIHTA